MKRTLVAMAALAVVVSLFAGPPAAVAAPGDHAWSGTVFSTTGAGDESAVAVAVDAAGRPVVAGSAVTSAAGDHDIRCSSWTADGLWRWTSVENTWDNPASPGADDRAAGVLVDDARSCVYVAGTTQGAGSDADIVLLKFADGLGSWLPGQLVWAVAPGIAAGTDDEAEGLALDGSGNVYVTGGARRADGSWDVVTLKLRPNGAVAWIRRHNSGAARFDRGLAVAVRGAAVYVAGLSEREGRGDDLVLIKYSVDGTRRWVRYYDDPLHRHESLMGMAVARGGVYLCGAGKATSAGPGDALLVKFLADGRLAWAKWAAGDAGGDDAWTDVAVDGAGRVHVTGAHRRRATGDDIVTALYTAAGLRLWQRGYSTVGRRMDVGTALAVDAGGRTYVCGARTSRSGETDVVALKYGPDGATLWATVYPDPAAYPVEFDLGDDWAADVAVAGGLVYVAGQQVCDHSGVVDADLLVLAVER